MPGWASFRSKPVLLDVRVDLLAHTLPQRSEHVAIRRPARVVIVGDYPNNSQGRSRSLLEPNPALIHDRL